MKICVINLPSSSERRSSIQQQLDPLGVEYSILPAVKGSAGLQYFEKYDETQYQINTGRVATAGEIGCYASHLLLWNLSVEANEPILILEDDAEVQQNFLDCLLLADRLIDEHGLIRFQFDGSPPKGKTQPLATYGKHRLQRYVKYPFGALAYAVSPAAAQRLIARSRTLNGAVDHIIKRYWEHGQTLFGLSPAPVVGGPLIFESTIHGRKREKPSAKLRFARWFSKTESFVRRARFNVSQSLRPVNSERPTDHS